MFSSIWGEYESNITQGVVPLVAAAWRHRHAITLQFSRTLGVAVRLPWNPEFPSSWLVLLRLKSRKIHL